MALRSGNPDAVADAIDSMNDAMSVTAAAANIATAMGINSFNFFSDPQGVFGIPGGFATGAFSNTTNFGARGGGSDPEGNVPGIPGPPGFSESPQGDSGPGPGTGGGVGGGGTGPSSSGEAP